MTQPEKKREADALAARCKIVLDFIESEEDLGEVGSGFRSAVADALSSSNVKCLNCLRAKSTI